MSINKEYKRVVYKGEIYLVQRVLECLYNGEIKKNGTTWRVLRYDDYRDEEAYPIFHNDTETLMESGILHVSTIHKSYILPILLAREHQTYDVPQNHLSMVIKGDCSFGCDDVFLTWNNFEGYIRNAF